MNAGWARWLHALLRGVVVVALVGPAEAGSADKGVAEETLVVFVQPGASALSERFEAETLPELHGLAEGQGLPLTVVDVTAAGGAPVGVGITPLIVYQNHAGRSVYQGRYATLDRVKNFIRTSRYLPQGDEPLVREDLMVREAGRALIGMPLKITALNGEVPEGFDAEAFATLAMQGINQADERSYLEGRVELGRSDRLFYFDFYPHRAADGELWLGLAVYSQFHCHEPVFTSRDEVHGRWDDRAAVFAAGFRRMSGAVDRLLRESTVGDGFDPVAETLAVKSWDELGLALPATPEGGGAAGVTAGDVELVQQWEMDEAAQDGRPAVLFSFPAPLDGYAGEATDVTGTLTLGDAAGGLSLAGMTGTIRADPASVTMGEADLDEAIRDTMLRVDEHPGAWFDVESVETDFDRPRFGQVAAATLVGTFHMTGRTVSLRVPTSLEAYVGDDGRPRLSVDGRWELRLGEPFGLTGPPGEAPANDTLVFTCHLVFAPAAAE